MTGRHTFVQHVIDQLMSHLQNELYGTTLFQRCSADFASFFFFLRDVQKYFVEIKALGLKHSNSNLFSYFSTDQANSDQSTKRIIDHVLLVLFRTNSRRDVHQLLRVDFSSYERTMNTKFNSHEHYNF